MSDDSSSRLNTQISSSTSSPSLLSILNLVLSSLNAPHSLHIHTCFLGTVFSQTTGCEKSDGLQMLETKGSWLHKPSICGSHWKDSESVNVVQVVCEDVPFHPLFFCLTISLLSSWADEKSEMLRKLKKRKADELFLAIFDWKQQKGTNCKPFVGCMVHALNSLPINDETIRLSSSLSSCNRWKKGTNLRPPSQVQLKRKPHPVRDSHGTRQKKEGFQKFVDDQRTSLLFPFLCSPRLSLVVHQKNCAAPAFILHTKSEPKTND